ncbi:DUF3093 domain-containing protein [Microbacterium betulae]|uniref:DUF3093 domain-containing protein n=1 Tax=Microbacterium betulae TaxID=2981139 RepID=A0AA97FM25_9MICO|nr:DUF3093 domain-containing protein [Microbacterium sp. AB]WOF24519.1 DUF3093 domain-containing protein [Microbacterium sp. AB]
MQNTVSSPNSTSSQDGHAVADFRERLSPSLWTLASAAIVAPMVTLVFVRIEPAVSLGLGAIAAIVVIALLIAGSPVVEVRDGVLRAGKARIEVEHLGDPVALAGEEAKAARGVDLDPRGWYLVRGGIDGVVLVPNTDPDDPVTSWTISIRTPDRLAAAVLRAQAMPRSRGR